MRYRVTLPLIDLGAMPLVFGICMLIAASGVAWAEAPPSDAAQACPAAPIRVEVNFRVSPVAVSTDLTFQEISALAKRARQPLRHPPYGFYLQRIADRIEVKTVSGSGLEPCIAAFRVNVDLALVGRRIEIASDLKQDTCLFHTALEHYRRHAEADERVFRNFAIKLSDRMQANLAGNSTTALAAKDLRARYVAGVFESLLKVFDRDRQRATNAVDSASEVDRMRHPSCLT